MKIFKLNIPDFVDIEEKELKIILAARLFELRRLSLGQASEVAELSKKEFIETIGKYSVSLFNYPISDLQNDINNA